MKERVKVNEEELKRIYNSTELTLDEISEKINSDFRNHLYKGSSFPKERFDKLQELVSFDIKNEKVFFIDGKGETEQIKLVQNQELAELFGILLGDGHIDRHSRNRGDRYISSYYVSVTLNSNEEELIARTEELFSKCLGEEPNVEPLKHASAVNVKIYGKEFVDILENAGLESGNKIKNQVGIPNWIKEDENFQKSCLRGLIDTDGSIYSRESGDTVVYFKNKSSMLLEDFVEICRDLGFRASKAGNDARQIAAQEQVEDFISEIDPIKAKRVETVC